MLISPYFLRAYWTGRKESPEQCARRLARMLSAFSAFDRSMATWYEQARTRKLAIDRHVDPERLDDLLSILNRGRHRRKSGRSDDEELGFTFGLWNGWDGAKQATISVSCGSFSKWVGNSVVLNFPADLGDLRNSERMAGILATVARVWEPDSAGVMLTAAVTVKNSTVALPIVDWMLYLSKSLAPQLPALPAKVQTVDAIGSIIVVQDEPPDRTNPEHLQNISRVESAVKGLV